MARNEFPVSRRSILGALFPGLVAGKAMAVATPASAQASEGAAPAVAMGNGIGDGRGGRLRRYLVNAPARAPMRESPTGMIDGGADSNLRDGIDLVIRGADTAGRPSRGYANAVDLTPNYTAIQNFSGYNQSTDSNDGRTGIAAYRARLVQNGQGDLYAFNASVLVQSHRPGATHWLANPAGVLFAGSAVAAADGVYLNPIEIHLSDKPDQISFNCTAIGTVYNMAREHPGGHDIGQVWSAVRAISAGSVAVDTILSATGRFLSGLDLSMPALDFGSNKAAVCLKAGDRIYLNARADELRTDRDFLRANWRATTGFDDYICYDRTSGSIQMVVGGQAALGIGAAVVRFAKAEVAGGLDLRNGATITREGKPLVGAPISGWTRLRGQEDHSSDWDTATIDLQSLARRVKALESALHAAGGGHGLLDG